MKKIIAIGLSPNTTAQDAILAVRLLFSPLTYLQGNSIKQLEHWFVNYFKTRYAISFTSGRSALYAVLHCLDIGSGDEVLLQSFTCVAVPNAVIATGAKPVYADIAEDLDIDVDKLVEKITKKTRAIILQHTFGVPANFEAIATIAKKYRLFIIEDVAHTIGGEYKGKKLGQLGGASIFSFGRDKAFSSTFGGMAITQNEDLGKKLRLYQKQKNYPSFFWVIQQLLYPIISWFILTFYYFLSLGKILHFVLRRFNFFSFPVSKQEKNGMFNPREVKKFPNALARLALLQIKRIELYNKRRIEIAQMYFQHAKEYKSGIIFSERLSIPLLRFPVTVVNKKEAIRFFAKNGIYIGDWYNQAIDPVGVDLEKIYYKNGSCPKAEEMAKHIINLPTYPRMKDSDVEKVLGVLKKYKEKEV